MAGEGPDRRDKPITVVPELRGLHSPDLWDLQSNVPGDPENCCVLIQAFIGPKGSPGQESFNFVVCTPAWISHYLSQHKYLLARHYLLVERYDFGVVQAVIEELCNRFSGNTWNQVAEKLSRFGHWEFEDYMLDTNDEDHDDKDEDNEDHDDGDNDGDNGFLETRGR